MQIAAQTVVGQVHESARQELLREDSVGSTTTPRLMLVTRYQVG